MYLRALTVPSEKAVGEEADVGVAVLPPSGTDGATTGHGPYTQ